MTGIITEPQTGGRPAVMVSLWPVATPLACSQMITNFVGGRGGAIIIVLWNAPIIPVNGPSVMRLMVGDLICIALS